MHLDFLRIELAVDDHSLTATLIQAVPDPEPGRPSRDVELSSWSVSLAYLGAAIKRAELRSDLQAAEHRLSDLQSQKKLTQNPPGDDHAS